MNSKKNGDIAQSGLSAKKWIFRPEDDGGLSFEAAFSIEKKMEEETTLESKTGCYALTRYEDIAILRLGKDFLFESIDLSVSNRLLDVFERISQSREIGVLAIMNCPEKIGGKEYIDFCRQAISAQADHRQIHRVCNIFDQLILKIVGLNKLVIHADGGKIIPLFLNISLACDYRIVSTHTTFQKPYFESGELLKTIGFFQP